MAKHEDALELAAIRERNKHRLMRYRGGIYVTHAELEAFRATRCNGCGGELVDKRVWFSEWFCGRCVYKFERGERP